MTNSLEAPNNFQTYKQRQGHDISGVRLVMIPDDGGDWVNRSDAEHLAEQLKRAQSRIAELERDEYQALCERDRAENHLAEMYRAVIGESPEWSSAFGFGDAVDEVIDHVAELEAAAVKPIEFSESVDADDCRKFAWEHVRSLLGTEVWTVGDGCTYFGFYCWGWDMRRQYDEQRATESRQLKPVKLPKGDLLEVVRVIPVSTAIEAIRAAGGRVEDN